MSEKVINQVNTAVKPSIQPITFNWANNPNVKNLLDVISSILAEEYIEIAKQNRDIFSNGGEK